MVDEINEILNWVSQEYGFTFKPWQRKLIISMVLIFGLLSAILMFALGAKELISPCS
jgi:hypothetical protein